MLSPGEPPLLLAVTAQAAAVILHGPIKGFVICKKNVLLPLTLQSSLDLKNKMVGVQTLALCREETSYLSIHLVKKYSKKNTKKQRQGMGVAQKISVL